MGAHRKALTGDQNIDVYEWLKANNGDDIYQHLGCAQIAKILTKLFGYPISEISVARLARRAGAFDFYTARVNYGKSAAPDNENFTEAQLEAIRAEARKIVTEMLGA